MQAFTWQRIVSLILAPVLAICLCSKAMATPDLGTYTGTEAEQLFAKYRPALVTVRTSVKGTTQTNSYGSGFFVDRQGRILTNYHVIASYALDTAHLSLAVSDNAGHQVPATLLSFSVVDDLAVVQAQLPVQQTIALPFTTPELPTGTHLVSLGDPHDLGATLMSGHFSSRTNWAGRQRIHFSGSLNSGMSGGPVLDNRGMLVGINASRRERSEQVSFLVPAQRALSLYTATLTKLPVTDSRAEIGMQLLQWQSELTKRAFSKPWPRSRLGTYEVPLVLHDELACWSDLDTGTMVRAATEAQSVGCDGRDVILLGEDFESGYLHFKASYLHTDTLTPLQFARHVEKTTLNDIRLLPTKNMAPQVCKDTRVLLGSRQSLPARLVWCAQAYRDLPDLYEVDLRLITQDQPRQALYANLHLDAITWQNAMRFTRQLLEQVQ